MCELDVVRGAPVCQARCFHETGCSPWHSHQCLIDNQANGRSLAGDGNSSPAPAHSPAATKDRFRLNGLDGDT